MRGTIEVCHGGTDVPQKEHEMSEYPPSRKGVISELMRLNYQSRDIGDMADGLIALFANAPERDLAKAWREGLAAGMKFSQSTNGNYAKNREAFLVNPYTPNA